MPRYYTGKARTTTTTRSRIKSFLATYKLSQSSTLRDPYTKREKGETLVDEGDLMTLEPLTTTDFMTEDIDNTPETTPEPAMRHKRGRHHEDDSDVDSSE